MNYRITTYSDELYHYGVKGMHWGIRRYQNYDGTRIGTGGAPVTRASAKVKNAYRKSVSGGQGGKATGMERVAATANPGGKTGLFDRTIKKGKGKENTSPAEEISKSVRDASRDAKPLVDIAEKHDPKSKAAREDLSKKAQKMSDKELRDQINRIRMEREYVDLKSSEINTGYDKAREILEIAGDVASIAVSIATLIAIVSKLKHEDLDPDTATFIEDFTNVLAQDGITLDGVDLDYLEHHGIKGMKWGVRRYQNYDGTRIGTGSGIGGSKASNSFRNSIAGGQGGKAIGTARLATKVPDRTSKYKNADTQKAVDAWKKHDEVHWQEVDPARDEYFKARSKYGDNDPRTKKAQNKMMTAINKSDEYAKIAVDKFKNIPYDDIDDDVLRIGQHSGTWKSDIKVEDTDNYTGPTIQRWSSKKQDFEQYKFESTNPNVEILGDAPGGEIALRRRPKRSNPVADAKAAKKREQKLAKSEIQDLKDAYRLTGDRSFLQAAKDRERKTKRR